ncbi:hypothetical protein [Verrucomicrobium sp. BvORR034]|uniref:hypothetical protein n=1 Tax=Verrucomicrobium sp. BvORR034 TaxID=1396418 RepID=UPI00224105BC|nr:hypothetical protein [Verrucomicrobium sp. BvORR034]
MSSVPQTSAASAPNVVLGGAALAVGALIAGVAIGRRSRWGLVVGLGVAAVAGYQLLKQRREQALDLELELEPPAPAPVAHSPVPAPVVAFAPAPLLAEPEPFALPSEAKVAQEPAVDLAPAGTSLAPLIWEGGDSGSRSSDDLGETVWFGLQDVALAAASVPEVTSFAPSPASMGEVALEADLAPVIASFLSDFPPAPQLEMPAPPPLTADVAALIQALNPPPLTSSQFVAEASAMGASVFAGVSPASQSAMSFEDEDDSTTSDHESFLLEDDQNGGAPAGKGVPLAAAALVLLSLLGLGLGFGQMKAATAPTNPVAVVSQASR